MGYRIGDHAGHYELVRILGRGSFAEVFLANDLRYPEGRQLAVKTVACDVAGDAGDRAREAALAEAKLLQGFQHPNIVVCEEVCWETSMSMVWLALELMDGGDVQTLIETRREEASCVGFEDHLLRRLLAAVGSALCYIHSKGVLHRDVKPANMLIARRSQRIKLGDFGISKILQATARARTVVGTPYYLAPEMVSGQDYGAAADAWALGVSLYEAATLQRPFEAANPLALAQKICHEEPGQLPAWAAPDMITAVSSLLRKDSRKRSSLREVLHVSDAVAALATELPSEAPPTPRAGRRPSLSLSDKESLSPVSLTLSDSGCLDSAEQGDAEELVASLNPASRQQAAKERHKAFLQLGTGSSSSSSSSSSVSPRGGLNRLHGRCLLPAIETRSSRRKLAPVQEARSSWRDVAAIAMARAALNSEDDDIGELQMALSTLEREGCQLQVCSGAWEALQSELQLRLAALTTDTTMVADLPRCHDADTQVTCLYGRASAGATTPLPLRNTLLEEDADDAADQEELELTPSMRGTLLRSNPLLTSAGHVQQQIVPGSWTSLLTLQITWGTSMRVCMLPPGASFVTLLAKAALRFGLADSTFSVAGFDDQGGEDAMVAVKSCPTGGGGTYHHPVAPPAAPPLRRAASTSSTDRKVQFVWRNGSDVVRIFSQSTWDQFLRLLAQRLGSTGAAVGTCPTTAATARLELQTQMPITADGRGQGLDKRGAASALPSPLLLKVPPLALVGPGFETLSHQRGGGRGPCPSPQASGINKALRLQCKSARRHSARGGCQGQLPRRPCGGGGGGAATHRDHRAAAPAPQMPVSPPGEQPPLHLHLRGQSALRGRAFHCDVRDPQGLPARVQAVGGG
mmetsp:Transcript_49121/g.116978  ORF Transcript_49121/g.116978 Transcript_49121/m.116978 type:complete len:861 (-) Transcript_49121:153-2735(-)